MKNPSALPSLLPLLLCFLLCHALFRGRSVVDAIGTADGLEEWGYVEVRPKVQMFWWLYRSPHRVDNGSNPWPTILWLQGGPGGSGTGIGNFQEIGPLDINLVPRNSSWLLKADLLFVDSPVGTGYSYVEDEKLVVSTDEEAAADLTSLLKELCGKNEGLERGPLFIFAESYGGKFAATLGLSVVKAIQSGDLKLKLGGVTLGDSWISPEDFVFSWGPLLKDISRLDATGAEKSNSLAETIKQQLQDGKYGNATNSWTELESTIASYSNNVDFYNFLLDASMDPLSGAAMEVLEGVPTHRYSSYLSSKDTSSTNLDVLMNGVIREKLGIIPKDVRWGGQSNLVFAAMAEDFMKPRVKEVDELLSMGINVTIYNGQLDLICATKGTEAWMQKLGWEGLNYFTASQRGPLYCERDGSGSTKGFIKSYQNLHFYWVLGAGHFVPVDQPCLALKMVGQITQSPAAVASSDSFL